MDNENKSNSFNNSSNSKNKGNLGNSQPSSNSTPYGINNSNHSSTPQSFQNDPTSQFDNNNFSHSSTNDVHPNSNNIANSIVNRADINSHSNSGEQSEAMQETAETIYQDAKDMTKGAVHAAKSVAEAYAGDITDAVKDGTKAVKELARPIMHILLGITVFFVGLIFVISTSLGEIPSLIWNGITMPYEEWAYAQTVDAIDDAIKISAYSKAGDLKATIGSSLPRSSDRFDFSLPVYKYFDEKGHNANGIFETNDNDNKKVALNFSYAPNDYNTIVFDYMAIEDYVIPLNFFGYSPPDGGEVAGDLNRYIFNNINCTISTNYKWICFDASKSHNSKKR